MKEVYLDNAATTSCDPKVLRAMSPYWSKSYGNPSSFNDAGRTAKKAVEEARRKIALILGARPQEIVFTSSATESNNLAILGVVAGGKEKKHMITTAIEHHSVLEPARELEKSGFKISYLKVDREGIIDIKELERMVYPETILVSVIYANNEIGSVQSIKKIAKALKGLRKGSSFPYFHVDASQAQHLDLNVNNLGVDLMTLSSHKVHGPKGVAALYVRRGTSIKPLLHGGGQEWGLRSSTEAVPLIVGFGKALELSDKLKVISSKKLEGLRDYFVSGLEKVFPEVKINGPESPKDKAFHIVSAIFKGVESEQALLHLDRHGIRASAGSACASKEIEPSHVLRAIGLSNGEARSTIRFSFSRFTKKSEIDRVLDVLPKVIKKIMAMYPKEIKKHYYTR